jgi:BirA family biotin operon repressor/biotin-[acetyl-CoA-carboxylase] ligase
VKEEVSDIISAQHIHPIHRHETIDSTNSEAMRMGEAGAEHKTIVVAYVQTAGRGKLDSRWVMPAGEGILLSILLREMPRGISFGQLTLQMGGILAQWLGEETHLAVQVKKPNDLLIGGKKVCGILSEARWRSEEMLFAVVGIGINVNVTSFPDELSETATSLKMETGREFDLLALTNNLIERLWKL